MANPLVEDAKEFVRRFSKDDVPGLGAELAYRFLFAIFPFVIFLAALSAFVAHWMGTEDPTQQIMSTLGSNLPPNLTGPVQDQLSNILGHYEPGLLSFGAILALYAASGGMNALMKAMSRAFEVEETRPFLLRYAFAIGLTVLGGAGLVVSFVIFVGAAVLTRDLASRIGLGSSTVDAISVLRWPVVFVLLTLAVSIVYRYAGNVRPPWRWALLGAVVFSVLWLIATFAFGFYVASFAHYDKTYGTIGGVIVLMLWFYLTSLVLVGCAELVAVLVRGHSGTVLESRRAEIAAKRAGTARPGTAPPSEAPASVAPASVAPANRPHDAARPAEKSDEGATPA